MAVGSFRRVALLLAVGLVGCDAAIGGPSSAVPVVQSLLIAGDSIQSVRVEWRFPADSPIDFTARPVDSSLVHLSLVVPGGGTVPFTPVRDALAPFRGRFDAIVVVAYGATYRLQGTVAGREVFATTTAPDSLTILEPAQDTVRLQSASCFGFCDLSFRWTAVGADQYQYIQAKPGGAFQWGSTGDTAGVIRLDQPRSGADTTMLTVYALEQQAAAFLLPENPKGNVTGVFGLFGAASRGRRVLLWQ